MSEDVRKEGNKKEIHKNTTKVHNEISREKKERKKSRKE
jgi:hypothetical protein